MQFEQGSALSHLTFRRAHSEQACLCWHDGWDVDCGLVILRSFEPCLDTQVSLQAQQLGLGLWILAQGDKERVVSRKEGHRGRLAGGNPRKSRAQKRASVILLGSRLLSDLVGCVNTRCKRAPSNPIERRLCWSNWIWILRPRVSQEEAPHKSSNWYKYKSLVLSTALLSAS